MKRTSVGGHVKTDNNFGLVNYNSGICQTKKDKKSRKKAIEDAENASYDVDLAKQAEDTEQETSEEIDQSEQSIPMENAAQTRKAAAKKEDSILCEELKDIFQRFGTVKVIQRLLPQVPFESSFLHQKRKRLHINTINISFIFSQWHYCLVLELVFFLFSGLNTCFGVGKDIDLQNQVLNLNDN